MRILTFRKRAGERSVKRHAINAERERLQGKTNNCQEMRYFLVGCGMVGVGVSTGAGGTRILTARPATDGTFSFRDLPAGDYKLVAVEDAEPDSWYDPNVLKQMMAGSMSVKITEGERKVQDIRIR